MNDPGEHTCYCGHARDDHKNMSGECLDDDCECIAFDRDYESEAAGGKR